MTRATSERGVERWDRVDLARLVEDVVLSRRHDAGPARRPGRRHPRRGDALGDASLIESLVANLLDNAIRHNVSGVVDISTVTTDGGGAALSIGNTGPVIPAADVERLFGPFQRLGVRRVRQADGHGLGLGLAIVQAIATAHGAALTARSRAEGGLEVSVGFSAAPFGQAGPRPRPAIPRTQAEPAAWC